MTRTLIVLAAYLLSSIGILLMLTMIGPELGSKNERNWFVLFVWPSAWVAHLVMCVAWINDRRLHWAWPVGGTVLGLGSFLVWPLSSMKLGSMFQGIGNTSVLDVSAPLMLAQLVLVAPCVLLGLWLVRYHTRPRARMPSAQV